ncbi:uncharacterized protein N7503_008035 [Penicillium pulvis]|uniref:uncharacterized protein n=1 Tax=Penicillium pulvis TaxID=1562058 RepID=UPI002548AA89|nr:uncharacterized protein N7503_008035 [Penicillium pulvis]KAJ5792057.1 hypothetical protein N7503_008035 [Penicillium pulvis]
MRETGPWANYILSTPWWVQVRSRLAKTDAVFASRLLSPRQELNLRSGCQNMWTGESLSREIGLEISNVEAATIQVVRTVQVDECTHYQQNDGPFALCVKAPGSSACGNCHWKEKMKDCSFYDASAPRSVRCCQPDSSTTPRADLEKMREENHDNIRQELKGISQERTVLKGKMKQLQLIIREARLASAKFAEMDSQNCDTLSVQQGVHLTDEYNIFLRNEFVRAQRALIDQIMTDFEKIMTRDLCLLDRMALLLKSWSR